MMAKYQDVMVVPPSHIQQPAAIDFFDVRKWMSRFSGSCGDFLQMFTGSQTFTQWLEQRLAPRDSPLLEVVFFNEHIDAKLMRSAKTKLFTKQSTPLLATGELPEKGYNGLLVPAAVRTVYNASMIAARPVRAQQQVGLLVLLGSGMCESEPFEVEEIEAMLKREFARNLLWSRVDVGAALLVHVCPWTSAGNTQLHPFAGTRPNLHPGGRPSNPLVGTLLEKPPAARSVAQRAGSRTCRFVARCSTSRSTRAPTTSRSSTAPCARVCTLWRRHPRPPARSLARACGLVRALSSGLITRSQTVYCAVRH